MGLWHKEVPVPTEQYKYIICVQTNNLPIPETIENVVSHEINKGYLTIETRRSPIDNLHECVFAPGEWKHFMTSDRQ